MAERVPSRDVLDPNAKVSKAFRGRIVGRYERLGPNSWDDYGRIEEEGDVIDVLPGLRVQVEAGGVRIRMRTRGQVVIVEWQPTEEDTAAMDNGAEPDEAALRGRFCDAYLGGYASKPGIGVTAHLAKLLRR